MVLALSKLLSGETSGEMQVSNSCKRQVFTFISVFGVCMCVYVFVCVCSMCFFFSIVVLFFPFNVLCMPCILNLSI